MTEQPKSETPNRPKRLWLWTNVALLIITIGWFVMDAIFASSYFSGQPNYYRSPYYADWNRNGIGALLLLLPVVISTLIVYACRIATKRHLLIAAIVGIAFTIGPQYETVTTFGYEIGQTQKWVWFGGLSMLGGRFALGLPLLTLLTGLVLLIKAVARSRQHMNKSVGEPKSGIVS